MRGCSGATRTTSCTGTSSEILAARLHARTSAALTPPSPPACRPENFLLASHDPDAEIKISDFGLSCFIEKPDSIITDACGSAYYIAPEVFTRRYTKAADVWALGVILFLLLSGSIPFGFNAETEAEVYKAIQRDTLTFGATWKGISAAARELVSGLLEKVRPARRLRSVLPKGHDLT